MRYLIAVLIFIFIVGPLPISAEEWTEVVPDKNAAGSGFKPAPTPEEDPLQQIISIDYKDADLASVLRSLAWTYKLNLVTSPDIKGKVTLNLKDVTLKEALGAIVGINGLAYSQREGIIYIAPGDPQTVEMDNEVIFLKYISASEAQNILKKVISPKGDIKVNEVSNSLIVTDFLGNINKLKELINKLDLPPQQVIIEAKIVDINTSDLQALGVSWTANYQPSEGIFDRSTRASEQLYGTLSMAEQSADLSGGQFVLNALTFKGLSLTATIDALVKDAKANILATPSIAVLNGQEARIVIGERYPYKERTQTTSGTTETTKFVDIGTTLRVTPQINQDGYITMRIHPEVSSLAQSLDAGPRITTREADTTVRVKEGETLIIGGLIKQQDNRSWEKVPILGKIPIVGALFSRREQDVDQKELAVFITPKILRSQDEKGLISKKEVAKEEAYVALEKTGQLGVVEWMYKYAKHLDEGIGIESVRKSKQFRKTQALNLYEHIATEFPDSNQADQALFHAGLIYYQYFKDFGRAKEKFGQLVSDYPQSQLVDSSKRLYRKMERILNKRKK